MDTRFKVFASYNILQYLCDFIHVLIFVIVSKCRKNPNLTNIVMRQKASQKVSHLHYSLQASLQLITTPKGGGNLNYFAITQTICPIKLKQGPRPDWSSNNSSAMPQCVILCVFFLRWIN